MMFRLFQFSIAVSIMLLSASAGFDPSTASPPAPNTPEAAPKVSPKPVTKLTPSPSPAHPSSGLIGVNKQTVYSSSGSTFAQTRRVLRTERSSNTFRDGAAMLWDKDRAEEQQRLQRRARQRAQSQQQRLRLQKQILKASPSPSVPSHQ